jgi:hypothetical protein
MNRTSQIAALVLSIAAAGSAFAEGPIESFSAPATVSTLTRADVTTQVLQAQAAGTLVASEADLNRHVPVLIAQSREAVHSQTLAAVASGEAYALGAETNAFSHPFTPAKRATVLTQMASLSR